MKTNKITQLLLGTAIVGVLHFCVGTFLYTHPPKNIKEEGLLLFAYFGFFILPVVIAFAGYIWVYWRSAYLSRCTGWRVTVAILFALVGIAISEYAMMFFCLNEYGS